MYAATCSWRLGIKGWPLSRPHALPKRLLLLHSLVTLAFASAPQHTPGTRLCPTLPTFEYVDGGVRQ
jgi:hypothetical protein